SFDYAALQAEGRVLAPLHHPDPAHCLVTGTGLTHLGSATARDAMHQNLQQQAEAGTLTDSMRMFQWGLDGGIPEPGRVGAQPEWFYKGDGQVLVAPGAPLPSPDFALDGGEEPELVGLYVIDPDGTPHRLGFALGNEFSNHVTERQNYLYLAHSKLRPCALGPPPPPPARRRPPPPRRRPRRRGVARPPPRPPARRGRRARGPRRPAGAGAARAPPRPRPRGPGLRHPRGGRVPRAPALPP